MLQNTGLSDLYHSQQEGTNTSLIMVIFCCQRWPFDQPLLSKVAHWPACTVRSGLLISLYCQRWPAGQPELSEVAL